ncbi:MAG: hypothetical protein ACYDEI_00050 [Erysipelotrichaceae bacterium]
MPRGKKVLNGKSVPIESVPIRDEYKEPVTSSLAKAASEVSLKDEVDKLRKELEESKQLKTCDGILGALRSNLCPLYKVCKIYLKNGEAKAEYDAYTGTCKNIRK